MAAKDILDALRACAGSLDVRALGVLQASVNKRADESWIGAYTTAALASLTSGDPSTLAILKGAGQSAVRDGRSDIAIEAKALRALVLSHLDRIPEALALARAASRMSRTEGIHEFEAIANITLARVRRLSGAPHLANSIVRAVASYANASYAPILGWESLMATGLDALATTAGPAVRLRELLELSFAGDQHTAQRCATELIREAQPWLHCMKDAANAVAVLGHSDPAAACHPDVLRWIQGRSELLPLGLGGLLGSQERAQVQRGTTQICVAPQRAAHRMLALGPNATAGSVVLSDLMRIQPRTEQAIATLAFCGPTGLAEETFFLRTYGFTYSPQLHRGTMEVLFHRVRQAVGEVAHFERSGGVVRLTPLTTFFLRDPKQHDPVESALRQTLAATRGASAKSVAQALDVPLRTVQALLDGLVRDKVCRVARQGRSVTYRIEDTTFEEPTRQAVKPGDVGTSS